MRLNIDPGPKLPTVAMQRADGARAIVNESDAGLWRGYGFEPVDAEPDVVDPTPEQISAAPVRRSPGRPRKALEG